MPSRIAGTAFVVCAWTVVAFPVPDASRAATRARVARGIQSAVAVHQRDRRELVEDDQDDEALACTATVVASALSTKTSFETDEPTRKRRNTTGAGAPGR